MPAEQPKEASTQIDNEKPHEVLKKSELEELRRQKSREWKKEYNKNYYQIHKEELKEFARNHYQKNKEKFKEYKRKYRQDNKVRERERERLRERYHSDPEFRAKNLESSHKRNLKLQEDYKRFKIEYGGKCTVCGEYDLDVLEPHHPDGKNEGGRFIKSKEFRDWLNYGIKPNVVLMCANHHGKLHILKARGELVDPYNP